MVEAATYISGPYATMMLADLGASVVKVEPPRGDPYRRWGRPETEFSAFFAATNRGKQDVVLNLKDDAGRQRLLGLLDEADVFVCNWRPDAAARLGLADASLVGRNPGLIRTYVTGYGPDGPSAGEPAFDTVVQARSGMAAALGRGDQPVLASGYPIDKLTAVMVAQAVLAALVGRARTGRGERVDISMLDVACYLNLPDLLVNRVLLDHQPADPRNLHALALRAVPASDGWIVLAPASAAALRRACEAMGHPEWAPEVLAAPGQDGMIEALINLMSGVTRSLSVEDLLARFRSHDVAAARCVGIDEHLSDPQVLHNDVYRVDDDPRVGRVRSARYPAVFSSWGRLRSRHGAPGLGQDGSVATVTFNSPDNGNKWARAQE